MDLKQLLATLLAHADEIQDQDAELIGDLVASYKFDPVEMEEPDTEPEHEAQETPGTEALEHKTGVELGEPLGEVSEEVEEGQPGEVPGGVEQPQPDMAMATEPAEQPQEGDPLEQILGIVEGQGEMPMEMAQPTEPVVDPLAGITQQIDGLKGEIQALKSLLEKVAIRTPISEEEAEKEEKDENFGAKPQQGQPRPKEFDAKEQLIRKLGGLA